MKKILLCIFSVLSIRSTQAQFGVFASGVQLDSNGTTQFYATNPANPDPNAIGTSNFLTTDLGTFIQNSGLLSLTGAQIKTFKNGVGNVCSGDMYYAVYPVGNRPAGITFTDVHLDFYDDCSGGAFVTGGACGAGDQKWQNISQAVDLTANDPGTYTLELYYQANGANGGNCNSVTMYDNNSDNPTNYSATFTISVITPVILQSFTATPTNNTVSLKWTDAQEINVAGFELERSTDGKTYTAAAWQSAKGAASVYAYTDNQLPDAKELFYRLKIVDQDGSYKYSYIVPVDMSAATAALTLQLVGDNVTVNTKTLAQGLYTLQLYSVDGRLITNKHVTVASSNSSAQVVSVAGANLPNGIYAIVLRDKTGAVKAKNTVLK